MNCGSRSPGLTSYWSRIASMPSESSLSARLLTHARWSSVSQAYDMNTFGTTGYVLPSPGSLRYPCLHSIGQFAVCGSSSSGGSDSIMSSVSMLTRTTLSTRSTM